MMKYCWSPWYYYDNLKSGSFACAATSAFFSVFSIIYISHCMAGYDSSQFFLPLFETDVRYSMQYVGGILILFHLIFIMNAYLMVMGIRRDHRGMILPWLTQNIIYILMIIGYDIWMIFSFYQYLESVFWFLIYFLYTGIHIYMHRCVKGQYNVIKDSQKPYIIQLY